MSESPSIPLQPGQASPEDKLSKSGAVATTAPEASAGSELNEKERKAIRLVLDLLDNKGLEYYQPWTLLKELRGLAPEILEAVKSQPGIEAKVLDLRELASAGLQDAKEEKDTDGIKACESILSILDLLHSEQHEAVQSLEHSPVTIEEVRAILKKLSQDLTTKAPIYLGTFVSKLRESGKGISEDSYKEIEAMLDTLVQNGELQFSEKESGDAVKVYHIVQEVDRTPSVASAAEDAQAQDFREEIVHLMGETTSSQPETSVSQIEASFNIFDSEELREKLYSLKELLEGELHKGKQVRGVDEGGAFASKLKSITEEQTLSRFLSNHFYAKDSPYREISQYFNELREQIKDLFPVTYPEGESRGVVNYQAERDILVALGFDIVFSGDIPQDTDTAPVSNQDETVQSIDIAQEADSSSSKSGEDVSTSSETDSSHLNEGRLEKNVLLPYATERTTSTAISPEHPENQDRTISVPSHGLFAVIDGVGQGEHSHVAAQIVKEYLTNALSKDDIPQDEEGLEAYIKDLLRNVPEKIGQEMRRLDTRGATVLALVKRVGNTNRYLAVNVGDSAIFVTSREHPSERLFREEHYTQDEVGRDDVPHQISGDQFDPERHASFKVFTVEPGTKIAIMSDGVTDNMTDDEIMEAMAASGNNEVVASDILNEAEHYSRDRRDHDTRRTAANGETKGKTDDISVVGVYFVAEGYERMVTQEPEDIFSGLDQEKRETLQKLDALFDSEIAKGDTPRTKGEVQRFFDQVRQITGAESLRSYLAEAINIVSETKLYEYFFKKRWNIYNAVRNLADHETRNTFIDALGVTTLPLVEVKAPAINERLKNVVLAQAISDLVDEFTKSQERVVTNYEVRLNLSQRDEFKSIDREEFLKQITVILDELVTRGVLERGGVQGVYFIKEKIRAVGSAQRTGVSAMAASDPILHSVPGDVSPQEANPSLGSPQEAAFRKKFVWLKTSFEDKNCHFTKELARRVAVFIESYQKLSVKDKLALRERSVDFSEQSFNTLLRDLDAHTKNSVLSGGENDIATALFKDLTALKKMIFEDEITPPPPQKTWKERALALLPKPRLPRMPTFLRKGEKKSEEARIPIQEAERSPEAKNALERLKKGVFVSLDAYRSLQPKQKMAISLALLGIGLAGTALGLGPLAGAAAGLKLGVRVISAAAFGRGVSLSSMVGVDPSLDKESQAFRNKRLMAGVYGTLAAVGILFVGEAASALMHGVSESASAPSEAPAAPTEAVSAPGPAASATTVSPSVDAANAPGVTGTAPVPATPSVLAAPPVSTFESIPPSIQVQPGDTLTKILGNEEVLKSLFGEEVEKLSEQGKRNLLANLADRLQGDQLRAIGIMSGDMDKLSLNDKLDIQKLKDMIPDIKVDYGNSSKSLLERAFEVSRMSSVLR